MKTNFLLSIALFFCFIIPGKAQQVPGKLQFADLELKFTEGLRRELQAEVDKLTKYPSYFNVKLERAKLYFPIIERIFTEEKVPDDFKYLVIQESALIPDAVSSSNAVGFWQFKKPSAEEMGLRVDKTIDERMNINASTRAAARYLKTNKFYYDNWLYALLAYYAGRGGVKKYIDEKNLGTSRMDLNKKTHWYLKKFLAHKIAVENNLNNIPDPDFHLYEYKYGANKNLNNIASEFAVNENELFSYNKWLRRGKVPYDKDYVVIIPMQGKLQNQDVVAQVPNTPKKKREVEYDIENQDLFPMIEKPEHPDIAIVDINGKAGVIANKTDNMNTLTRLAGISKASFLEFNDLESNDEIEAGQIYYFQPKRNKAKTRFHVVQENETIWDISQKYAIKLHKIKQKNRYRKDETVKLKTGRVLWLRYIRPRSIPIEYKDVPENNQADEQKEYIAKSNDNKNSGQKEANADTSFEKEYAGTGEQKSVKPKEEDVTVIVTQSEQSKETKDKTPDISQKSSTEPNFQNSHMSDKPEKVAKIEESEKQKDITHTVKAGETLYSLSKRYAVEIEDILRWNDINAEKGLQIGQKIEVKLSESNLEHEDPNHNQLKISQSSTKSYIYHKVAAGETMYKIARQYDVTIKEIMEWNDKDKFDVKVGENIKILK